jgi:tetratricopeptide (TPR) repeat protein
MDMKRLVRIGAAVAVVAAGLAAASIYGFTRNGDAPGNPAAAQPPSSAPTAMPVGTGRQGAVERLEARVAARPDDHVAWASLAVAYVDDAAVTGNSDRYRQADEALARSLDINNRDNFTAQLGLAAVAAARHDFRKAEAHARRGLELNPSSAALHGVLSDALIQLGRYDEAFATVQRMVDLSPDTASLARVAYTHELKGNTERARAVWARVRDQAPNADDRALALFHLGELALGEGDANTALGLFNEALRVRPGHVKALSGKAHALAVSGQTLTATDTYRQLLAVAPTPDFLIEVADFFAETGRQPEADKLYAEAEAALARSRANGMRTDAGLILYQLDRGNPAEALRAAETLVADAPSAENHEAHAWALYRNRRHTEAVTAINAALQLGTRNADLHLRAAAILDAAGDPTGARHHAHLARTIDPEASLPEAEHLIATTDPGS